MNYRLLFIILFSPLFLLAKSNPLIPIQQRYSTLLSANEKGQWKQVVTEAEAILSEYEESPFGQEAMFYLGVGHFKQGKYDWANRYFSEYLKHQAAPKHFEEVIEYKFNIAKKFKEGSKKHLLGSKMLPQWMPAKSDALSIYDEVIAALPHHDLAVQAFYAKGQLLAQEEDFRTSLDAYQTLIRRFPKHHLAIASYIGIQEVYFIQAQIEYPDPDLIDLAEINLRKFRAHFPQEGKIAVAEAIFGQMQEYYAQSLYETGRFFERTKKYSAAAIYYSKVVLSFPKTKTALQCKERLEQLKIKIPQAK